MDRLAWLVIWRLSCLLVVHDVRAGHGRQRCQPGSQLTHPFARNDADPLRPTLVRGDQLRGEVGAALGWGVSSEGPGVTNLEPEGFAWPGPDAFYVDLVTVPDPETGPWGCDAR
ncbi:hypothetical protein [Nonomuraea basaltis]|uniref:hypothetical protein n=1 Tax=Nonomuraea basaltis TaxID=2495887 RepID=UPI003B848101